MNTPSPILLSVPPNLRLEALSAALKPLGKILHYRPDPRPAMPQTVSRAAGEGTL